MRVRGTSSLMQMGLEERMIDWVSWSCAGRDTRIASRDREGFPATSRGSAGRDRAEEWGVRQFSVSVRT